MAITVKKKPVLDMKKNVIILVLFLHVFWNVISVTGAVPLIEDCKKTLKTPQFRFDFCFNTSENAVRIVSQKLCPKSREIYNISNINLYVPRNNSSTSCSKDYVNSVSYDLYNGSCLQSKNPKDIKKLILPIMRTFSGKRNTDVSNEKMVNYSGQAYDLTLPKFTWMSFDYLCSERNVTDTIFHLDMCGNVTGHGIAAIYNAHIDFSPLSYNKSFGFPTCSCYIRSDHNDSKTIKIRAIDVRLRGDQQLKLKGNRNNEKTWDSPTLYWWPDGYLLETEEEAVIELGELSLSNLPDSVWLQIFGRNLTITCGAKKLDKEIDLLSDSDDDSSLGLIYIFGIVFGAIFLVVLLLVVARKVHQRLKSEHSYSEESYEVAMDEVHPREASAADKNQIKKDDSQKGEVVYSFPHKPAHPKKETEQPLIQNPQEYMLLENEYSEAGPSQRNKENPNGGRPYSLAKQPTDGASCSNDNNNTYSRLREKPKVVPNGNLYDITGGSEYSTCQTKKAPVVIDNIYD